MDFHVLEVNQKEDTARVAFHIATPTGTNTQGLNYSDVLVEWRGTLSSDVPNLDTRNGDGGTESTAISNGEVYEHIETVEFDAEAANPDKLTVIRNRYNQLTTLIQSRIQNQLKFWGYSEDVA
jgi:hypothetical protein